MLTYRLTDGALNELLVALEGLDSDRDTVSVVIDGGLKVKVNEGMWTPPLGRPNREPGWVVVNNMNGRRVTRVFDTESKANSAARNLNSPNAGGLYGVEQVFD